MGRTTTTAATRQKTRLRVSESVSLKLVKNLFRLSVSTVCYLRNIFPDEMFEDLDHGCGTKIKLLKTPAFDGRDSQKDTRKREAKRLMGWLENGIFDAMSKGYLKTLVFSVYQGSTDDDASNLAECYMYKVRRMSLLLAFSISPFVCTPIRMSENRRNFGTAGYRLTLYSRVRLRTR